MVRGGEIAQGLKLGARVTLTVIVQAADVKQALAYGRRQKYTAERDDDLAGLIANALGAGAAFLTNDSHAPLLCGVWPVAGIGTAAGLGL